jgi:hypothetical protein
MIPFVLYGYESWSVRSVEEYTVRMFEKWVMRIFLLKYEVVTGS